MRRRIIGAVAVAVVVVTTVASRSVGIRAQDRGVSGPPLVVTAHNGGEPVPYAARRTPWGDPDLQGVWSSDDTSGIPLSRPPALGDRLYQNDEEFAARVKQMEEAISRAENADGTIRFDTPRRAFRQTSLIVDPLDGRTPAYTPRALSRSAPRDQGTFGNGPFNSAEDFTLYERCITRGVVGSVLRVLYGNGNRIVQGPGVVAISYEMIHDTRVFYTNGRPHVGDGIRQYLGDSRARWDGDELVVETTNLTDQTSIGVNGNGLRHSDQMTLTERFKRVADDVLQYQITIDDPLTYERPFTLSMPLTPLDGGRLLPYACHEGNMALVQSLGAEREEDRRLAEDLAKGIVRQRRPVQGGVGPGGNLRAGSGGRGRGAGPPGAGPDGPPRAEPER